MPLINQTLIDNLDGTSTPEDVQDVLDRLAAALSALPADGRDELFTVRAQQSHKRSLFLLSFVRDIPNATTLDVAEHIEMEVPEGLPPLELFHGQAWARVTAAAGGGTTESGGTVQLYVNEVPVTDTVQLVVLNSIYQFPPFSVTLDYGDILSVRCDTTGGAGNRDFLPLVVNIWGRIPLVIR